MKKFKQGCIYGLIWSIANLTHVIGVPNLLQSPVVLLVAVIIFYSGYIISDSWEDWSTVYWWNKFIRGGK